MSVLFDIVVGIPCSFECILILDLYLLRTSCMIWLEQL